MPSPVERVDFVALSLLPVHWWRDVLAHLRAGNSPTEILEAFAGRRQALEPGAGNPDSLRLRAQSALSRAHQTGIDVLAWSEASYPAALSAIIDPPPVLWLRGLREALDPPAVAIVGSRAGSPYSLAVAERLAGDLAARGITIVSGLARGVDSAAHRGALMGPGSTVAVLGSGADRIYPSEHRPLALEIIGSGAVVSELPPGTPPLPHFFPRRNRIISGLVRAVVVIEAGERSGSLITARSALDQGREVLAVPGNVLSGRNRGGHALLRDGAKIVESADDILEEMGLGSAAPRPASGGPAAPSDPVLACLPLGESCDLDTIVERSGLTPARLLPRLLELELKGHVRRAGGGRFIRFDRSC